MNIGKSDEISLITSDPDNDPLTLNVTQPPTNGILTGFPLANLYQPNMGFQGEDSNFYSVSDSTAISSAGVSIVVHPQ